MDRRPDAAVNAPVAVIVGAAAEEVRLAVGPLAWCALEVLAAAPAVDGERWVVRSSVREVAARLGVAPNTAQRALGLLREGGLVTAIQDREHGGRFGGTAYRLTVDVSVLCRQTCEPLIASRPMVALQPCSPAKPVVAVGEQLVLLPSV
jgi:DNA-binding transcriptional ArsR family regulator